MTEEDLDQFRDGIRPVLLRDQVNVVVNLRAVPYIDSTGLGEIVRAFTTATRRGGTLKLLQVTGRTRRLLTITRLLTIFDVFDVESEAVSSFGAAALKPTVQP